jgi:hypothetical protein
LSGSQSPNGTAPEITETEVVVEESTNPEAPATAVEAIQVPAAEAIQAPVEDSEVVDPVSEVAPVINTTEISETITE